MRRKFSAAQFFSKSVANSRSVPVPKCGGLNLVPAALQGFIASQVKLRSARFALKLPLQWFWQRDGPGGRRVSEAGVEGVNSLGATYA